MSKKKKFLSLALAITIVLSLSACGGSVETDNTSKSDAAVSATAPASVSASVSTQADTEAASIYPLVTEPKTLTLWSNGTKEMLSQLGGEYDNQTCFKKAEEITGVHIEITEVSMEQSSDKFNLMAASGDYCDMIRGVNTLYSGGLTAAYNDDVIIPIQDYLEQYAPDFYAYINQSDDYLRLAKTDEGDILDFKTYFTNLSVGTGPQIRQDWLNALGLEAPTTYDEYTNVLTAFQKEYNITDPIYIGPSGLPSGGFLLANFGVGTDFYQIDGTVHYAPLDDGFKQYLTLMNQWYNDKLISSDFYSRPDNFVDPTVTAILTNGHAGLWYQTTDYITSLSQMSGDSTMVITAIADAANESGEVSHFISNLSPVQNRGSTVSITSQCEDVELATEWLNFWFSEKGILLANYGVENEAFAYDADGNPQYTDLITNNSDGLAYRVARLCYVMLQMPTVNDDSTSQSTYTQSQLEALDTWGSCGDGTYLIPDNISMTMDEASTYANTYADIKTYITEMIPQFITGEKSLDDYSEFTDKLKSMEIQKCIEIYQAALNRYNER